MTATNNVGALSDLTPDGDMWLDRDGVSWSGQAEYLGISVLGFCGCGRPVATLRYVRAALELVAMKGPEGFDEHRKWWHETYAPAKDAVFKGHSEAEYFMWYALTDRDLLEHGGGVPGWLTDKGKQFLADLRTLDLTDDD